MLKQKGQVLNNSDIVFRGKDSPYSSCVFCGHNKCSCLVCHVPEFSEAMLIPFIISQNFSQFICLLFFRHVFLRFLDIHLPKKAIISTSNIGENIPSFPFPIYSNYRDSVLITILTHICSNLCHLFGRQLQGDNPSQSQE